MQIGDIMIQYITASKDDIELLMQSRLEMLKVVNDLPADYVYDDAFVANSRAYFYNPNQTTILAMDEDKVIGCATMCYIEIMPTFSHPTGKRAHLMNVYTNSQYRRQGIASSLTSRLAVEILNRGKVPFYCAAWCNIKSVRNALRSGFRPAWVEMMAKPCEMVDGMNQS